MSEYKYLMSDKDLQSAIYRTNEMISSCRYGKRMDMLADHLKHLLDEQKKRSSGLICTGTESNAEAK